MSETRKTFHIAALLSLSTGRLCCKFPDLHALIEHLAGGPVWTHQIPTAADALTAGLVGQHPWLVGITPPEPFDTEPLVDAWVTEQAAYFGAEHEVTVLEGGWRSNPLTDLAERVGAENVIPVIVP